MKKNNISMRLLVVLIPLVLAALACSLTEGVPTPQPNNGQNSSSTALPSCTPANTPAQEADILYNAQVAEHNQAGISITILTPNIAQLVEFVKPDRFHWKNQAGNVWDESISVGGVAYARGSAEPDWKQVPALDATAAILMQSFIDPPKRTSGTDLMAALAKAGITNPKIDGWLVKFDPTAFFGSCIYALTFKSGDTVVYSQQTWIGPTDGLRYKFEAKDEHGVVTETRLFDYENVKIDAP